MVGVRAELALAQLWRDRPGLKAVYIAPIKALVAERVRNWGERLGKRLGKRVVELTGDSGASGAAQRRPALLVTHGAAQHAPR